MASIVLSWDGVGNAPTIMPAKKSAKKSTPAKTPSTREPRATARKRPAVDEPSIPQPARRSRTRAAGKPPASDPDALAREAYLVYRHRAEHGLPGDAESDWLEAEKRLGLRS